MTLADLRSKMTVEELTTWIEFYNWEHEEQEKALKKSKAKGGRRNRKTIGSGSK